MSTPKATTIILHSLREKMGISVAKYVFCDIVHQIELSGEKATVEKIISFAGRVDFFGEQNNPFIKIDFQHPHIYHTTTDEWKKHFNVDADFEEFWKIWQMRGVKKKAATAYKTARKKIDKETLHKRAKITVDAVSEWKFIPHAQNWLANERWNEFNPIFDTPVQNGNGANIPTLVM